MPGDHKHSWLERLRLRVSRPEALLSMSALGILAGLLTALVIVAFRQTIETGGAWLLPDADAENFEALSGWMRFLLPVAGGLLIGLLFQTLAGGQMVSGIVEVLERISYHQGHIGLRRLLLQFVGASIAIISGHSLGREGPGVHLGAASASLMGNRLGLPSNCIRTLVACGVAAAIGASFNTPLAGVVFAIEVIMLEYTAISFLPVILAAVSATTVSQIFYGSVPAFTVPDMEIGSLLELPGILLIGVLLGAFAAGFNELARRTALVSGPLPFWIKTTLAGVIVGLIAQVWPQVMGIGYDTVNSALLNQFTIGMLVGIGLAKLLATAACVGLGVPAGLIASALLMGATLGGAGGLVLAMLAPEHTSSTGLYVLLGMGAMMGAVLQAPLAALTALLELTVNPHVILPGMLAIAAASLTSKVVFNSDSVFLILLRARGLDYRNDPVTQALRRVGVASVMNRDFARLPATVERASADRALQGSPQWIVIEQDNEHYLLAPIDLARWLEEQTADTVSLLDIPGLRLETDSIPMQANLQQAVEVLDKSTAGALLVEGSRSAGGRTILGILTRDNIEAGWR